MGYLDPSGGGLIPKRWALGWAWLTHPGAHIFNNGIRSAEAIGQAGFIRRPPFREAIRRRSALQCVSIFKKGVGSLKGSRETLSPLLTE